MAEQNKLDLKNPILILIAAIVAFAGNYFGGSIAPKPEPKPTPQQWVVTKAGSVVDAPDVVTIADKLEAGNYELLGLPKAGAITRLGVTITADGNPPNPAPTPPVIPPAPTPTPVPPKPALTGFALEVFEHCKGLPAKDCQRLADNYESVSSQIAAGGILTPTQAENKIFELNKALALPADKWTSFALWIGGEYEKRFTTVKQIGQAMDETAKGLREVK